MKKTKLKKGDVVVFERRGRFNIGYIEEVGTTLPISIVHRGIGLRIIRGNNTLTKIGTL